MGGERDRKKKLGEEEGRRGKERKRKERERKRNRMKAKEHEERRLESVGNQVREFPDTFRHL